MHVNRIHVPSYMYCTYEKLRAVGDSSNSGIPRPVLTALLVAAAPRARVGRERASRGEPAWAEGSWIGATPRMWRP
eukprot:COSAG02_NODE_457_length_21950_cov_35.452794_17_plen_76_part_00